MPDRHARCAAQTARVRVLLPLPLGGAYDYAAAPELALSPGDFVRVPLGPRDVAGVVWDGAAGNVSEAKLKHVAERLPAPALKEELRRFIEWVANYTLAPAGAVLRMAMSVPDALVPARGRIVFALAEAGRAALGGGNSATPARRRVLEVLASGPPLPAMELARQAACGAGVVRALAAAGLIEPVTVPRRLPPQGARLADARPRSFAGAARGRQRTYRHRRRKRVRRHVARRRHRLGQDRSLFRGDRRGAGARAPGAGAIAGDRAFGAMARALCRALRRGAGRMAFRSLAVAARGHVARCRRGQGESRGRCALGAVPAVRRSRPHRHRRRAGRLLQAGGRRLLSRARHGGGARLDRRRSRSCSCRRRRRSRPSSTCSRAAIATSTCRRGTGARGCRRSASSTCAARGAAAAALLGARAGRCAGRDACGARAGNAVPQPARICAADAVQVVRPSHELPQLHGLAGRAPLYRHAAMPSLRP